MEPPAVNDLKNHLHSLTLKEREELSKWLDGHANAVDELLECVWDESFG